jgi:hypothetical protein
MNAIASEAVNSARTALNAAIRAGADTLRPRKELSAAEQAAEKEKAMSDKILAQAEAARRSAIEKEVTAEVAALTAAIEAECQAVLPGYEVAVNIESHRLTMLLEARGRRDEVETARAELAHDIENLNVRLAEVQTQIDALHAKPDRSEADNGSAHFLLLDKADIEALIQAATAQLETLELPALGDLERAWQDARRQAKFAALHQVMVEMEKRLLTAAVAARDAYGPGAGTEYRYKPCQLMRQSCVNSIV